MSEGINLAEDKIAYDRVLEERRTLTESAHDEVKRCVFISHKKCDEDEAVIIGRYITEVLKQNIYLDKYDPGLQNATQEEEDEIITEIIKRAIEVSDKMLCIISPSTINSWWVPYEIGYGDSKKLSIASVKIVDSISMPSFLQIQKCIYNVEGLKKFLKENVTGVIPLMEKYGSYNLKPVAERKLDDVFR